MITIQLQEPEQTHAAIFNDAESRVFLDTDQEFSLRLTKVLEQLTQANRVAQEAALTTSIPWTEKNALLLSQYQPDHTGTRSGIKVVVQDKEETINVERLRVLKLNDQQGSITRCEIELYGGGWIDDLEECKLNQLELGTIEYLLSFVLAGWADNTALVVAPPADYGFFNTPGDLTRKDLRFKYNIFKLMKQAFCQIGWRFESPFYELGPGAHYYGYLNKERWYDYSNKDSDYTVITNRATPTTYPGGPTTKIEFDEVKDIHNQYGVFAAGPLFTYANPTIQEAPLRIRIEDLKITVKQSIPAGIFKIKVVHQKGLAGAVGTTTNTIAEETIQGSIDQDVTRDINIDIFIDNVVTSFEFFFIQMECETLIGANPVNFIIESGVIRYMPMFKYYVEGNTITVNELLRDDIDCAQLYTAMAHLCRGVTDTNYNTKTVTLYSPFDFLFDGTEVEGFFRRNSGSVDLTNKVLTRSRQVEYMEDDRNRFVELRFANPSCAYIASTSDEEHPFSRTIDLGSGKAGTDTLDNKLFEPSLEVFTPPSAIGGDGLFLPAHWNNTEGNESNDIGIRIGYHHGLTEQEDSTTGDALEFSFEGTLRTEFGHITQDPRTNIEGTSPYHRLVFSDDAQDLYELCYRRFLKEQFNATTIEFLIWINNQEYVDFQFRNPIFIEYQSTALLYQAIALKDFATGKRISTPILLTPIAQ